MDYNNTKQTKVNNTVLHHDVTKNQSTPAKKADKYATEASKLPEDHADVGNQIRKLM